MNTLKALRSLVTSKYLALAFRLYLGGLFIYASLYKITYPGEFAQSIAEYQLAPHVAVNAMALGLPWLELLCGGMLLAGIRAKTVTVLIGGMLAMFLAALVWALLNSIPMGCGCFHSLEAEINWWTALRDVAWLAMAVHVYYFDTLLHLEKQFVDRIAERMDQ